MTQKNASESSFSSSALLVTSMHPTSAVTLNNHLDNLKKSLSLGKAPNCGAVCIDTFHSNMYVRLWTTLPSDNNKRLPTPQCGISTTARACVVWWLFLCRENNFRFFVRCFRICSRLFAHLLSTTCCMNVDGVHRHERALVFIFAVTVGRYFRPAGRQRNTTMNSCKHKHAQLKRTTPDSKA